MRKTESGNGDQNAHSQLLFLRRRLRKQELSHRLLLQGGKKITVSQNPNTVHPCRKDDKGRKNFPTISRAVN